MEKFINKKIGYQEAKNVMGGSGPCDDCGAFAHSTCSHLSNPGYGLCYVGVFDDCTGFCEEVQ